MVQHLGRCRGPVLRYVAPATKVIVAIREMDWSRTVETPRFNVCAAGDDCPVDLLVLVQPAEVEFHFHAFLFALPLSRQVLALETVLLA